MEAKKQGEWLVFHGHDSMFQSPDTFFFHTPERFGLVAKVEAGSAEEVFSIMNQPEWDTERIDFVVDNRHCRSTSVGDVLVDPDGEALAVSSRGFFSLGNVRSSN